MARKVFFSFHYENDVWRANVVRNSWVTADTAGFIDWADFEEVKKGGDAAIKKWIDDQLIGTSVTVVLIGSETNNREYVRYELQKSYERGNGILGIYIHNIKDSKGNTSSQGSTTFGTLGKRTDESDVYLFEIAKIYDWVIDDGYNNFSKWVEEAAKNAGK